MNFLYKIMEPNIMIILILIIEIILFTLLIVKMERDFDRTFEVSKRRVKIIEAIGKYKADNFGNESMYNLIDFEDMERYESTFHRRRDNSLENIIRDKEKYKLIEKYI